MGWIAVINFKNPQNQTHTPACPPKTDNNEDDSAATSKATSATQAARPITHLTAVARTASKFLSEDSGHHRMSPSRLIRRRREMRSAEGRTAKDRPDAGKS